MSLLRYSGYSPFVKDKVLILKRWTDKMFTISFKIETVMLIVPIAFFLFYWNMNSVSYSFLKKDVTVGGSFQYIFE